eukprot:g2252.t1
MYALKTLLVLLSATLFVSQVAADSPCEFAYDILFTITTPQKCEAECVGYKGKYGDCFGWMIPSDGSPCYLSYVKMNATADDGEHCGVNPEPSVMKSKDSSNDEAPGSEEAPVGCYIALATTDLGDASTKDKCEAACLEYESEEYTECLVWLYDEEDETCKGILVEESTDYFCGAPATMPL